MTRMPAKVSCIVTTICPIPSCSYCTARARVARNADGNEASRKKDQSDDGELPIEVKQHADTADDRGRLFEDIAADGREPICMMRVSFAMRDMRKPVRILL